ncbi:hypothetical protein ACJIZ3_008011 [Penstemon smallii]|uniref:Uncharacterized protein n=1 Tax=Penstemon smallii TaxID=265156 RepID=A0ABD3T9Q2_9LAMI
MHIRSHPLQIDTVLPKHGMPLRQYGLSPTKPDHQLFVCVKIKKDNTIFFVITSLDLPICNIVRLLMHGSTCLCSKLAFHQQPLQPLLLDHRRISLQLYMFHKESRTYQINPQDNQRNKKNNICKYTFEGLKLAAAIGAPRTVKVTNQSPPRRRKKDPGPSSAHEYRVSSFKDEELCKTYRSLFERHLDFQPGIPTLTSGIIRREIFLILWLRLIECGVQCAVTCQEHNCMLLPLLYGTSPRARSHTGAFYSDAYSGTKLKQGHSI